MTGSVRQCLEDGKVIRTGDDVVLDEDSSQDSVCVVTVHQLLHTQLAKMTLSFHTAHILG